jgi:hypothetical protein
MIYALSETRVEHVLPYFWVLDPLTLSLRGEHLDPLRVEYLDPLRVEYLDPLRGEYYARPAVLHPLRCCETNLTPVIGMPSVSAPRRGLSWYALRTR